MRLWGSVKQMPTTMPETKYNSALTQPAKTSGQTEMHKPPAMTGTANALAAGLAHLMHEINNPLQLIYWTVNMMDTLMPKANGAGDLFTGKMFQELKGGVEQLVSLIGSLESQLQSLWMINPSCNSINVSSIIEAILQSEAPSLTASGIVVQKHFTADLPPILADETLLKQAFHNLVKNAADAMPDGGLLHIRTCTGAGSVTVEIADTGGGIPTDLDVFQPFISSKPRGMGLGLAITRHIVETYGGSIDYMSEPDKGTTFHVSLPRMIDTETTASRRDPAGDDSSDGTWKPRDHAPDT